MTSVISPDQELLDEEIARLREDLKVKVSRLLEAQGTCPVGWK